MPLIGRRLAVGLVFALAAVGPLSTGAAETPSPALVAHRGLARQAPENTLAAYAACLALHLGFETDVQRAQDGQLVAVHDDLLDRTTNGKGRVDAQPLEALRKLDAGSWFHPAFRDERIPTFDEIFRLVAERGHPDTLVAIDLKGADEQIEPDVVALAKQHGVLPRLIFIGRAITLPEVRTRLRTADRTAQSGRLAQTEAELPAALTDPTCDWAYLRFIPTHAQVDAVHGARKRVFIAGPTVAEKQPENWRAARSAGVDGFLTDEPLEAREATK